LSPSATKAALCIAGDAEWPMGEPKIAHRRVAALMAD
jgi:hypothetical protein